MPPNSKWIDGLTADSRVEDAAGRSLDARLRAVIHWLPLAAYLAEQDVEHVHRLRVSTRRAIAALRLYRDWLPRKAARWLKKRLKKIRRAAGEARDLDVLSMRLSHDYSERAAPVVQLIAERRAAVQPAIIDVAERSRRRDRFVRKTGRLLAAIGPPQANDGQPVVFRDWAAEQLASVAAPFFEALRDENADAAALHQFRIRGKRLRYTIELVAPAFGSELRDTCYPIVEQVQERLGTIQDHVTAIGYFGDWSDDARDAAEKQLLFELAKEERARVTAATQEFHEWWTAERVEALRHGLSMWTRGTSYAAGLDFQPDVQPFSSG
jgi:CHAD domain-containing protein